MQEVKYFLERVEKEMSPKSDGSSSPNRAMHTNPVEERSLGGMNRSQVPGRLVRFT